MIEKKLSLVISFNKTVDAMAFEEYCLKNKIAGRLIPLPTEISSGCGLAWKCDVQQTDEIKNVLDDIHIKCDKMTQILI